MTRVLLAEDGFFAHWDCKISLKQAGFDASSCLYSEDLKRCITIYQPEIILCDTDCYDGLDWDQEIEKLSKGIYLENRKVIPMSSEDDCLDFWKRFSNNSWMSYESINKENTKDIGKKVREILNRWDVFNK